MKAFLSHASSDKLFVAQVFTDLGAVQAEYDAETFDKSVFNAEAISRGLDRCDLFVLFASAPSMSSNFVKFESELAFERFAEGRVKRILVICIDRQAFDLLPDYLKHLNVVTLATSPGACFRRIQAQLIEIAHFEVKADEVFVGRELEIKALKDTLSRPSTESPVAVSLSGYHGIGRRTLLTKVMREILPSYSRFLPVELGIGASIEDLYLGMLRGRGRASASAAADQFKSFLSATPLEKVDLLQSEIRRTIEEGETLLISDGRGLLNEDGEIPEYLIQAITPWVNYHRPIAAMILTRMPPHRVRQLYDRISYHRIPPFDASDVSTLVGSKLRNAGFNFTASDQEAIVRLVAGHPVNVDFVVARVTELNGDVKTFLANPQAMIAWRNRRALDYIEGLTFSKAESMIVAVLTLFRFLPTELLLELCSSPPDEFSNAVVRLQELNVLEYSRAVHSISAPLADAIERSGKFNLASADERRAAVSVLEFVESYENEDEISFSLLEPAMVASLRAGQAGAQSQWRQLVLPSHYILLAWEAYRRGQYEAAIGYAKESLELPARMTLDAKVEAYRVIGLSAIRRRDQASLLLAKNGLAPIRRRFAEQIGFFLEGFERRYQGDILGAEKAYLQCFDRNARNFHVCRELGQVYLSLGRFDEAERFARIAYAVAPNNPFVLDILVGTLLGSMSGLQELEINDELKFLLSELERYGSGDGKSFYSRRMAELSIQRNDFRAAKNWADDAVKQTPWLLPPYVIRAQTLLRRNNIAAAERDIAKIGELSNQPGEDGRGFLIETFGLNLDVLIAKRDYRSAYNILERAGGQIPRYLKERWEHRLASSVTFDRSFFDPDIVAWAKNIGE